MSVPTELLPGPWTWRRNLGHGCTLTTAHGGAKVVLAASVTGDYHAEITARDEHGILKQITPEHPVARLIAAAPDMLEAATAVLDSASWSDANPAIAQLRAAIAKATNERRDASTP